MTARRHRGFFIDVPLDDGGTAQAHVLGDPKMGKRTREALGAVMRAAYEKLVIKKRGGAFAPTKSALVRRIRKRQSA